MKFGMNIVPVQSETYYKCEADSKEEAGKMGAKYAENNFCYGVDVGSIEILDEKINIGEEK